MKAIVAHGPHDLRIEERPDPGAPGAGEVRLRVQSGGICGSDLHYYHHGGFGTIRIKEPMILGHEASGIVEELGAGVSGLAIGDRVAINPSRPCENCEYCRRDMRNHCLDMVFSGSAMRFPHVEGMFREVLVVPAAQAVPVGAATDTGLAALAEPFAVCLHAARQAGPLLGASVLVSGCGPIGCLAVAAARRAGAAHITACDVVGEPLETARKLGADTVIDLGSDRSGLDALKADKGRIDVVFECSGNPAAVITAVECVRPRGRLVAVGNGGPVEFPLASLVAKEIEMVGSFRFDTEFALAADLVSRQLVDLAPLITHRMPAGRAVEAFDLASDRSRAMKVQLDLTDWTAAT